MKHAIVLHGLALNRYWMLGVASSLKKSGYAVHNISYPSRHKTCAEIVDGYLAPLVNSISAEKIDFVVHSMGGLLVRLYAEKYGVARIGRVVMLGTPNHGSEVADFLKDWRLFKWYFGPAGQEMVTGAQGLSARLPPVRFDCGVIAGSNHWFHFPADFLTKVPKPNDGIVSVTSTKVEGMKGHTVLFADHSLMVWHPETWRCTGRFLETGRFIP